MTCGIYSLQFGTGSYYIGKSVNIENRWFQHEEDMRNGTAANKVQKAYDLFGYPKKAVLFKCHDDHLDIMESYFINKLRPMLNSAATTYVSSEDMEVLGQDTGLLQFSTVEHLRLISRLSNELHSVASFDYKASQAKNIQQGEYLAEVLTELNRLKKRSLFQRIFNTN